MTFCKRIELFTLLSFLTISFPSIGKSATDVLIKERIQYGKSIRTRMPPQIMIDTIQQEFKAMSVLWGTSWQTFVVEDDESKDEFVIIARSTEKRWAFNLLKEDCPKPDNYEDLKNEINAGGTPVRMDMLIGVKKKRSFFRYVVNVYQPMYEHWKNPCYEWDFPPGKAKDKFYKDNYTMRVYSKNLSAQVYDILKNFSAWKPPKTLKTIPAIKGKGQELIGGDADELTDQEKALPISVQKKILEQRRKAREKEQE